MNEMVDEEDAGNVGSEHQTEDWKYKDKEGETDDWNGEAE
jgi:hypothetical protein